MIKRWAPVATLMSPREDSALKTREEDAQPSTFLKMKKFDYVKALKSYSLLNRSAHGVFFSHFPPIISIFLDVSLHHIL